MSSLWFTILVLYHILHWKNIFDKVIRLDICERKIVIIVRNNSQVSEVCKNTLVKFMKAESHFNVRISMQFLREIFTYLPKVPNRLIGMTYPSSAIWKKPLQREDIYAILMRNI